MAFICALCTGNMEKLSESAIDGADRAVRLVISMGGVMCLWTGVMKIADRGGITKAVSKILSPLLSRIMPDYDTDSPAMTAVSANITANMLGLGNAATPFGLVAMREMQKQNNSSSCIESCCVNGCPASLEAWATASVLSVDSASFSDVSRAFRVVREGSIFCNFVMPVFLYKSFATGSAYYVLRRCDFRVFATRSA